MKFFALVILCIGLIQSVCGVLTSNKSKNLIIYLNHLLKIAMNYKESITLNCPATITSPSWYLINSTASTTTAITTGGKYTIQSNNSLTVTDLSEFRID
jgi:hypothetical protein